MSSEDSDASTPKPNNAEPTLHVTTFSTEKRIKVIEAYVAKNYAVIHIHSFQDFDSVIEEINGNCDNDDPETDLKGSIESALFSTAAFRLDISFLDEEDGSASAQIPTAVSELVPRILNLELAFNIGPNAATWPVDTPADGSELLRAKKAMASLREHFDHLDTLRIYLVFDGGCVREQWMRDSTWQYIKLKHGPGAPWPYQQSNFLSITLAYLLEATRDHGPGKKKVFALSLERRENWFDRLFYSKLGLKWSDVAAWKPWILRNSYGIEFSSRTAGNNDGTELPGLGSMSEVVNQAWEGCSAVPVD